MIAGRLEADAHVGLWVAGRQSRESLDTLSVKRVLLGRSARKYRKVMNVQSDGPV
jgi:hypothetical protein